MHHLGQGCQRELGWVRHSAPLDPPYMVWKQHHQTHWAVWQGKTWKMSSAHITKQASVVSEAVFAGQDKTASCYIYSQTHLFSVLINYSKTCLICLMFHLLNVFIKSCSVIFRDTKKTKACGETVAFYFLWKSLLHTQADFCSNPLPLSKLQWLVSMLLELKIYMSNIIWNKHSFLCI